MLEDILIFAIGAYRWLIIIYIFMSWVPNARESSFGQFLGSITEPFLAQFRKIIPPLGMIDLSPIAALFALYFAQIGVSSLFSYL
ncbi:YggT family protein [Pseudalkalibacillus berkeleyi]|uniref:YggT family protein n=1 Tax=Pseudalkalibacillus berkeleyi TaxID=1069813 RepID=A0ABS9GZK8_9BACL|nr:YggT family protein [Pseudalkalibacillus berkeleyi]MCF6137028.1 YggT family protein [Pseudalkalibacillus berkeleyi]